MDKELYIELQERIGNLPNFESDNPLEPIDPLTWHSPEGDSCLHYAAMRGDLRSTELLLDAGMDINEIGDMGYTALHYAGRFNKLEVYDYLLERGADRDIVSEFGTKPSRGKS